MPTDAELTRLLDAMIGDRPDVDTFRSTAALDALCRARDETAEAGKRERLCLLIALVMAIKHPIGAPPWDALEGAMRS